MVILNTRYASGNQFTAGTISAGSVTGASGANDICRQVNTNTPGAAAGLTAAGSIPGVTGSITSHSTSITAHAGSISTLYDNFDTATGHDHDGNDSKKLDWDSCWADAVHNHTTNAEGGTITVSNLDWDTCWSDAVHSHASDAEGGELTLAIADTSDLNNSSDNITIAKVTVATASSVATGGNNTLILASGDIYFDAPLDGTIEISVYRDSTWVVGALQRIYPASNELNNARFPFAITVVDTNTTGTHTYYLYASSTGDSSNDIGYANLVVIPLKT